MGELASAGEKSLEAAIAEDDRGAAVLRSHLAIDETGSVACQTDAWEKTWLHDHARGCHGANGGYQARKVFPADEEIVDRLRGIGAPDQCRR
jgi:hypothetical protein